MAKIAVFLGFWLVAARVDARPSQAPQQPASPAASTDAPLSAVPPDTNIPPADPGTAQPKASLVGTVTDAESKTPLKDVEVTATSKASTEKHTAVTDASGTFSTSEIPPGEYTVRMNLPGYKTVWREGIAVGAGAPTRMDIELLPETPLQPERGSITGVTEVITLASGFSTREKSLNSLLLPARTLQVGGEITAIVSNLSPKAGEGLAFTDVGLVALNGRYSFGPVELAAATELLIKQPSYMDEGVPQAGSLTALIALGTGQAVALSGGIGPFLQDKGRWETATVAVHAKRIVDRTVVFKGSLGGNFTHLALASNPAQLFWFSEVVTALEAVLRTPHRGFAGWVGAELHIPVAYNPDSEEPDPAGFLDPQVRLNFIAAAAYTVVDDWDLFLRYAMIDRGDKESPQSMLPILNGGFDQHQLTVGVVHAWDLRTKEQHKRDREEW